MRVSVSLIGIGVLAISSTPATALGCKDISGAVVDPDLQIMASNFGRLLPDRKLIKQTKQLGTKVDVDRFVATRISTPDGSASAQLRLTSNNTTSVVATVDGRTIKQTTKTALADLGYRGSITNITTALAKIDQPVEAFVSPNINPSPKLGNLSKSTSKLSLGQHDQKVTGSPTTEKQVTVQFTCTKDLEFAGDPSELSTMVVLHGVLKATTITRATTINRFLDIKVTDVATFKTVSPVQFKEILSPFPDIVKMVKVENSAKPEPKTQLPPSSAPKINQAIDLGKKPNTPKANPVVLQQNSFITKITTFFSLTKPETWLLLFLTMLLGNMLFLRFRKPHIQEQITTPDTEVATADFFSNDPEPASEPTTPENFAHSDNQVERLQEEIKTATEQAKELRHDNLKLKTKLDDAENQTRDLTTQVIELQTAAALTESSLTADKRSVFELEGSNQRLMGVNEGYRENIKKVEAEYTALMHKLNLREDTLNHAERLNNEMYRFNEELNHALIEERAARSSLETDFDRLSGDYNNLWAKSSDRVAQFRNKDIDLKVNIRQLRDDIISLESELNRVREDRDNLNREFLVLGSENARASNEHKAATSLLESKVRQLHHDLAYYRQILDENRIRTPDRTHVPTTYNPRDYPSYQSGLNQARDEHATKNTKSDDNVIPLTRQNQDHRK